MSDRSRHFKRLVDGDALRATLARYGAELVIHGHDHVHAVTFVQGPGGPIPVVGVPSASEAAPGEDDPAGYNLYRIGGRAGVWRCEALTRGLTRDSDTVGEIRRTVLVGD
jgi:3',5'-cyclic AMP phosphodiesterase CpdA